MNRNLTGWGLGLATLLATGNAHAGEFYKCIGPDKQVSIQSDPCEPGWTQAWKRDAAAELPPSAEQAQALQQRRERERSETEQLSRMAGTAAVAPKPAKPAPAESKPAKPAADAPPQHACRQAHQFADAVRGKDFLELSNYQLSRLSEWVAEQCRDSE